MTTPAGGGQADDATLVLQRYLKAQEDKDLDALVSCCDPDVEVVHPLRPDRSWRGVETYRQAWALIRERNRESRFEVVSADVVGNRIYIEAYVEHADGTMMPSMNILEVADGRIRRGRVFTDRLVLDGVPLGDFVRSLNPAPVPPAVQPKDAADRFFASCENRDFEKLEHVLHADFEMIVLQKPARGFMGRTQEIANLTYLFDTQPDLSIAVLRKVVNGMRSGPSCPPPELDWRWRPSSSGKSTRAPTPSSAVASTPNPSIAMRRTSTSSCAVSGGHHRREAELQA